MAHGLEAAWVTNAKKEKGDRAERAALSWLRLAGFSRAERTRAGYERDAGDIHLLPGGLIIAQVKDQKSPRWSEWFVQLQEQIAQAKARHGFLLVKRARQTNPGTWLAVMPLADFTVLLRDAGYAESEMSTHDPNVPRAGETLAESLESLQWHGVSRECGCKACLFYYQNEESD